MDRISPTGDLAFKKVLASMENRDILSGLMSDFFGLSVPPEDITLATPYSIDVYKNYAPYNINAVEENAQSDADGVKENAEFKEISELHPTIKDVVASFKVADFISEMQISKQRHFDARALWYPFKQFCSNYNRVGRMELSPSGKYDRYSSLIPVYSLNILGFKLFNEDGDDDALRIFQLYDPIRKKKYVKDLMNIGFFELVKNNIETASQRYWRDYFLTGEASPDAPEYIKKASSIIAIANLSEEERNMDALLEKVRADEDAAISGAYNDGRDDEKKEIAKSMLLDGDPVEKIVRNTGLSVKEITALLG